MTLDTNQLYEQLNKGISVGVEDLLINKLNKIYSLDSDIELAKVFITEILDLYQRLHETINLDDSNEIFTAYYQTLKETENIINRYSDVLNHDAPEMREVKWFIWRSKYTIQGFEIIIGSFKEKNRIDFLERYFDGLNLIVEVLEDSETTKNYFFFDTVLGVLIQDFISVAPMFVEKKYARFKKQECDTAKLIFWQRSILRAIASAKSTLLRANTSAITRESTIKELYPDDKSYQYMETQGQLFDMSVSKLSNKYKNMYVHFEDGKVLDYDEDEETLIDRVLENNNYQDVFIERVS